MATPSSRLAAADLTARPLEWLAKGINPHAGMGTAYAEFEELKQIPTPEEIAALLATGGDDLLSSGH